MIDKMFDYFQGGQYLLGSLAFVVAVLLNLEKILSLLNTQKRKRLALLNEALKDEAVSDSFKEHLKAELQSEYFYQLHKVKIDRYKRELLLETHNKLNGEVSLQALLRASDLLVVDDEKLSVEITLLDNVSFYYNLIFGIALALIGCALLFVTLDPSAVSIFQLLSWLLLRLLLIGLGLFFFSQTLPTFIAKRLRKILSDYEQKSREPIE